MSGRRSCGLGKQALTVVVAGRMDQCMQMDFHASVDAELDEARNLFQRNEVARAATLLRSLHAKVNDREDVATMLAVVLRSQGRLRAASQVMLALCRAHGFVPELCLRAARFARECDQHAIARQICVGANAYPQVPLGLLILAGHVAREMGDFKEARSHYLDALNTGIDLGGHHVLSALANTKRYEDPGDPDLARFERKLCDVRAPVRSRASAGFGLAKALDDLGDYAKAARALRDANALARSVETWDANAWLDFVAACQRECVPAVHTPKAEGFAPVFIVGLPRTGTTLTANLLARATGARDRGELRTLRFVARQLSASGRLGDRVALAEAAELYRRLAVQDDAAADLYLDQDPTNFAYLHIIAALFPNARVIHLRRDRRDTALSLWSQDFGHPDMAFACDFGSMEAYIRGHDALMRHWRESLSLPIYELDYATLVTDVEATLAKLTGFLGIPAGAAADTRHGSSLVRSASTWQVRQAVYRTSVGRWKHYAPFVPELERFVDEGKIRAGRDACESRSGPPRSG